MYTKKERTVQGKPFKTGLDKESHRGYVTKWRRNRERYKSDPKHREKLKERKRREYPKFKEKRKREAREYQKKLSEFRNRHCKKCGKLLDFRTKGEYCLKHAKRGRPKGSKIKKK